MHGFLEAQLHCGGAKFTTARENVWPKWSKEYKGFGQVLRVVWTPSFTALPVGLHGM